MYIDIGVPKNKHKENFAGWYCFIYNFYYVTLHIDVTQHVFVWQSQGSVSIDTNLNDDGIVPSTPTLALPNLRNDGFAVAVRYAQ